MYNTKYVSTSLSLSFSPTVVSVAFFGQGAGQHRQQRQERHLSFEVISLQVQVSKTAVFYLPLSVLVVNVLSQRALFLSLGLGAEQLKTTRTNNTNCAHSSKRARKSHTHIAYTAPSASTSRYTVHSLCRLVICLMNFLATPINATTCQRRRCQWLFAAYRRAQKRATCRVSRQLFSHTHIITSTRPVTAISLASPLFTQPL